MAANIRRTPYNARVLRPVEGLGRTLELAIAALAMPVIVAARWGAAGALRMWRVARRQPPVTPSATGAPAAPQGDDRQGPRFVDGDPGDLGSTEPTDQPVAAGAVRRALSWHSAVVYLLALGTWVLFTLLERVDSALQQMGVGDQPAGSARGFPVPLGDLGDALRVQTAQATVDAAQAAWSTYNADVARPTVLRDPFSVAQWVVVLDMLFLVGYTALLIVALVTLTRLNDRGAASAQDAQAQQRRSRILRGAAGALAALFVVDLVENIELQRTVVWNQGLIQTPFDIALGPLVSLLKVALAVGVLVPILFVAFVLAAQSRPLRRSLASVRGVLYALAGVYVLLMVGIGAAQGDDVIRAWDGRRMALTVGCCIALMFTAAGVTRYLNGSAREKPAPDVGRNAQPLLLGGAAILLVAGQLLRMAGLGWGLSVAGALLAVLWALGVPVDPVGLPTWPELPRGLRWLPRRWMLAIVGVLGAALGLIGALVYDASLLLWVPLGSIVALAVLAAVTLYVAPRALARRDRSASAAALRSAQLSAELAVVKRDQAVAALADNDVNGWSEQAQAAATHAERAAQHADQARTLNAATTDEAARFVATARRAATVAEEAVDTTALRVWGDRLARIAGGAVAAFVVVAIARAIALDAYVRESPHWTVIGWPLVGAVLIGLAGATITAIRRGRPHRRYQVLTAAWFLLTVAAVVAAGWLIRDASAIDGAQAAGSLAVLLGGFTLLLGGFTLVAAAFRQGPIGQYALAPALRSLLLARFPVVPFLIVWVVVVSALDSGGYHDIRRHTRPTSAPPTTIGQAWQQYLNSLPPGGVRPVVFVAAQGGGIRAAVWTALVMECVFGPGPVAQSGAQCAEGAGTPDPARMVARVNQSLPVFLASGASGGSVGLAAWSARRADLVEDGAGSATPRTLEDALNRDFVAPDVTRLLLGDVPHAFLAWDRADRAEMLERAWERPWQARTGAAPARGLSRGLRQTWDVTHAAGAWSTPVLALNGASVEDGCRFLASAVDFVLPRQFPAQPSAVATEVDATDDRPDDAACRGVGAGVGGGTGDAVDILPSTSELVDYLCPAEDVPLSTAAHLSARFPYVSPTGRIERRPCPGAEDGLVPAPAISYDADGGIFDNSGAGTAVDTWRALAPLAAATERQTGTCIVPIFLQIDNTPPAATVNSATDPRPDELTAPINATLGQVGSREGYARAGAAATFGQQVSAAGQRVQAVGPGNNESLWFRIALYGQPGPEPPLGWTLAPDTVEDMRSQLRAVPNQQQILALRTALQTGGLSCTAS